MEETISFGEWLKRQRKSRDLTRNEVARRASCSVSALRRLEADDLRPSPSLAESLARVFNIPDNQRAVFVAFARGERHTPPDTPPTRGAQTLTHLPTSLTNLIGRQREVAALTDLLRKPNVRLLTLTGPPGTGKTRLSLAVGEKIARTFRDGVYFIALEPVSDPTLVAGTIAQTLGVSEMRGNITSALAYFLRDKCLLLILDNFEHLIPAASVVAELLVAAPQIKALATSREILHLYGEHEFPVPPLELINVQRLPTTQSLALYSRYTAIQLFKERARAAKSDFRLTPQNAADIARICAWLDGLPLAIEIAAAQIKWHTPSQLLAQLRNRLSALTGGPRDLTPRQQSLRGAIDWSYDLLDSGERRLFDILGIFWGGCAEEAIDDAVGSMNIPIDRLGSKIKNLVEKSLVRHELDSEGNARYSMLETIRDYARDKLAERGELERARQWHGEYYIKFAQLFSAYWKQGDDQARWLNRMEREHNNLRAAFAWSIETPARATLAMNYASAVSNFWNIRGYITEGRRWLQDILALDSTPSPIRAKLIGTASHFAQTQGDYAQARVLGEEGLAISQAVGDPAGIYFSMEGLAILAGTQGDYARAAELLEQVLDYRRRTNDTEHLPTTLNNLAIARRHLNNYERAQQLYAESIAIAKQVGNLKSQAHALSGLGEIHAELKDYGNAAQLHRECLAIRNQLGDLKGLAYSFTALAMSLHALGATVLAIQLESASDKIRRELGVVITPATRAEYENFIAQIHAQLDNATFERAWAEGQALSVEQAVALAQ